MLANNETGVIQPVAAGRAPAPRAGRARAHRRGAGRRQDCPLDVRALDVDLLTLSAHKLYGPKGIGALYVRRGTKLAPLVRGGAQERNRRAGTENVAGHRRLRRGRGARAAGGSRRSSPRIAALRDRLELALLEVPGARRNGAEPRVANTANVSFEGIDAEALLIALDLEGVAASTGAACAAGAIEPSHVLNAMGFSAGTRPELAPAVAGARNDAKTRSTTRPGVIAAAVERQRRKA